ncbi:MAG TPA: ABC transporter ATP-binding protein [Ardenticatenaceae bacterium]|nr:ABC transporter ATP-binding protein [Ardenticatenaceae bacterium]
MTAAIEFDHVSKRFVLHRNRPRTFQEKFVGLFRRRRAEHPDDFWAVNDVSFEIPFGKTVGLIGHNGSGKSTTLKLIAHILEPTSGRLAVNGRVAALLELGTGFHPDLTGRENVYLNGALLGFKKEEMRQRFDEIVDFAEIEQFIDVPVKHYSSGMFVRLGFAVAVHLNPEILLIDEVLAVGDAAFQHKCLSHIAALRRSGVTIVLVTHDTGTVQALCEQAIWFDHGQLLAYGHPTDVVMAYMSKVAQREEENAEVDAPVDLSDRNRWGNGKVRITRVELCGGDGVPRTIHGTGGPMEIRIHYSAPKRVDDPIFGLAIHHQTGAHICGPNTSFSDLHIPYVWREGTVIYRVPSLPLLEGAYELSVAVHNRADSEMYDYHDRAYPFRVFRGKSLERYGLVSLSGEWHLETEPAQTEAPLPGGRRVAAR